MFSTTLWVYPSHLGCISRTLSQFSVTWTETNVLLKTHAMKMMSWMGRYG